MRGLMFSICCFFSFNTLAIFPANAQFDNTPRKNNRYLPWDESRKLDSTVNNFFQNKGFLSPKPKAKKNYRFLSKWDIRNNMEDLTGSLFHNKGITTYDHTLDKTGLGKTDDGYRRDYENHILKGRKREQLLYEKFLASIDPDRYRPLFNPNATPVISRRIANLHTNPSASQKLRSPIPALPPPILQNHTFSHWENAGQESLPDESLSPEDYDNLPVLPSPTLYPSEQENSDRASWEDVYFEEAPLAKSKSYAREPVDSISPVDLLLFRATQELTRRNYRQALKQFRQVEKINPQSPHIPFAEGLCHLFLGEYANARSMIQNAYQRAREGELPPIALWSVPTSPDDMRYHVNRLSNYLHDNPDDEDALILYMMIANPCISFMSIVYE